MIDLLIKIPGPQFLLLFLIMAVACISLAWLWANSDGSEDQMMPGPTNLDTVSISVLSGGRNAVIRTVLFDLWNRNLIRLEGEGNSAALEAVASNEKRGTPIHEAVYQFALCEVRQAPQFLRTVISTLKSMPISSRPSES